MKPPKCRLCGSEHWPRSAHVWAGKAKPEPGGVANKARAVTNRRKIAVTNKTGVTNGSAARMRKWREANRDKDRERQRKLMKARRAEGG